MATIKSIEEKAKAYDEALTLMQDCIPDENGLVHVKPEEIFHELKESQDERIRKEIISALKFANVKGVYDKHIAWVEKQGEHKPADKVEPKFKVGQTIKKEGFNLGFTIVKIKDGFYYNDIGDYFPFTAQDYWELVEQKPAWSEEELDSITAAINNLEYLKNNYVYHPMGLEPAITFLKSLKDRVILQSKQGWSEEDEYNVAFIVETLLGLDGDKEYLSKYKSMANWLKVLKERYACKPGEHYELEEFAKIVRGNLTGISKTVQKLFEDKYLQLTGNKMYKGFKD